MENKYAQYNNENAKQRYKYICIYVYISKRFKGISKESKKVTGRTKKKIEKLCFF